MPLDPRFIGCIRIRPALNATEVDFLLRLLDSGRTLRGTPTGRGDTDVPFAHLAWEPCLDGCCLEWNPDLEHTRWMQDSLRFVVDHLLRPGAKGQGHSGLTGFSFDHVVSGVVVGRARGERTVRLVTVVDNRVTGTEVPTPCDDEPARTPARRPTPRFDNVIELRPHRA